MLLTKISHRERLTLQICISIAATPAVVGGSWDVLLGLGEVSGWASNHQRYLGGLLLAIGLGFCSTVPNIEGKTSRLRLLASLVFLGGLCRLLGLGLGDPPSSSILAALVMELVVAPLLCLWQARVAGVYTPLQALAERGGSPWPPRWQSSANAD